MGVEEGTCWYIGFFRRGSVAKKDPRPVRQEKRRKNPACGGPAWGIGIMEKSEIFL